MLWNNLIPWKKQLKNCPQPKSRSLLFGSDVRWLRSCDRCSKAGTATAAVGITCNWAAGSPTELGTWSRFGQTLAWQRCIEFKLWLIRLIIYKNRSTFVLTVFAYLELTSKLDIVIQDSSLQLSTDYGGIKCAIIIINYLLRMLMSCYLSLPLKWGINEIQLLSRI